MFQGFDRDGSGSIDGGEFTEALRQLGFNFSPGFVQVFSFSIKMSKTLQLLTRTFWSSMTPEAGD